MYRNISDSLFNNINLDNYLVQYQGNIIEELSTFPDYYVTILNDTYAIVTVKKDVELNLTSPLFKTIIYVTPANMYTLELVTPLEASKAEFLQLDLPLNLTGNGVTVAIIDSGIDYLNDEFMNITGETRIELIWDQTIASSNDTTSVPFGSLYTRSQINDAIKASRNGASPYDIVPSIDLLGHGTNMAGLIGGTGKKAELRGVVPDCNFISIKLIEDFSFEAQYDTKVPVFNITTVFAAFDFLYKYSLSNYQPLIIFFPLGTNLGSHTLNGVLEEFITTISTNSGIAVVSGTGNEGDKEGHASGIIQEVQAKYVIELYVAPEEKNLWVEFWINSPNIMSLDIISPSGENSGDISALFNNTKVYPFIFERTTMKVNYSLPEESTGDELIRIRFYNIKSGIWKLRLTGNLILDGTFNAWIPQDGIRLGNTHFRPSDPFDTITNPSNANLVITAAGYNQNNNNLVSYSGMSSLNIIKDKIDVAAGSVNAITTAPNGKTSIVNGTSVAAAIVAGACVMLFEWGIVNGNDPYIYSQTVKTYLARGTEKRKGDIYPNNQWGYGILNILLMFENMI